MVDEVRISRSVEDGEEILRTARCILVAALNPEQKLTIANIAMQTGLTAEQVRACLRSPAYTRLIDEEVRFLLSGILTRGAAKMDCIIHGTSSRDGDRVAAYRAVVQTYDALMHGKGKPPDGSEEDFERALLQLKALQGRKAQ